MCGASFCLENVMHTVSENQCGKYALLLQQART
ncbi:DUF2732 family protein, partial [Escherichia coli]